jgi:type II secretory pathway component GspD/PulD (secretin)
MKKWFFGLMWAITGCLWVCAGEPGLIELKGVVRFPKRDQLATTQETQPGRSGSLVALIEFPSRPQRSSEEFALLEEGQRQGDVEVVKINAEAGTVQARVNGELRELSLALNIPKTRVPLAGSQSPPAASGSIRLENASWREALEIYQRLVGRTLLLSSAIRQGARLSLRMDEPAPAEELAKAIEKALDGLVFHPDGEKFIVVGREGDFEKLTPELREVARKLPHPPGAQSGEGTRVKTGQPEQLIPAGMINFQNTDLNQVLQIFQELINRTLLHPAALAGSGILLRTQTPLTRAEANYALCATLALDGLSFVDVGDRFLFVYPASEEAKTKALFARKLPSHPDALGAQTIPPLKGNSWLDLAGVLKMYGELSGKPVELDQGISQKHFTFRPQTPLTTEEALHALDLLLGWEGLEVVKSENGTQLKVVRVIEN